jgi:hypothetical protein
MLMRVTSNVVQQMPNIEKLLAQAAKKAEKEKQLQEINPFG